MKRGKGHLADENGRQVGVIKMVEILQLIVSPGVHPEELYYPPQSDHFFVLPGG